MKPQGIGQKLRVRDLKPGMLVGLKRMGLPVMVVEVLEVARFAVVFTALGDKVVYYRTGDGLDAISHDSIEETHMFEFRMEDAHADR